MATSLEDLSPRMRRLLDAAVVVVGRGGLRALTHRAVDAEAGLPQGSCSAYLRTRSALHAALGEFVEARLRADVEAVSAKIAACPGDPASAAAETTALFVAWLRDRELVVTRLELALEAARDTELAAVFGAWRDDLVELVAGVIRLNRAALVDPDAGSDDEGLVQRHAEATVASLEGVLMAALFKPVRVRRAYVEATVDTLLRALTSHGLLTSGLPEAAARLSTERGSGEIGRAGR